MQVPFLNGHRHHESSHKQPIVVLEVGLSYLLGREHPEGREQDQRKEGGHSYGNNLCQPEDGDDGNTVRCFRCLDRYMYMYMLVKVCDLCYMYMYMHNTKYMQLLHIATNKPTQP